jgi:hypothetical protein
MAKRKAVVPDTLGYNIVNRMRGLHKQATVECSHYYVGRGVSDAINCVNDWASQHEESLDGERARGQRNSAALRSGRQIFRLKSGT